MHALFEEAGKFMAGRILSEADTSAQVELDSGKRVKVKAANILLKFEKPAPAELIAQAQAVAETIELDLAWEFAPEDEFGFGDLAREYLPGRTDALGGPGDHVPYLGREGPHKLHCLPSNVYALPQKLLFGNVGLGLVGSFLPLPPPHEKHRGCNSFERHQAIWTPIFMGMERNPLPPIHAPIPLHDIDESRQC